jgi:SEC-C motif domain protein
MRSRYTAFTRADIGYIERTLAPEEKKTFDAVSTKHWAEESTWKGLKILSTEKGGPSDSTGIVEFVASYEQDGKKVDHHEVSRFRKTKQGQWLFVDGDARALEDGEGQGAPQKAAPVVRDKPKTGRNDPCPCGSGKKFKKCCEGDAAGGI